MTQFAHLLDVLAAICELRSLDSAQHTKKIKLYTEILAREVMVQCPEYGLTECDCRLFRSVSGVHDIGKLTIPDSVLFKPGKLTQSEYEILKRHSVEGSDILRIALSEEQSYLKRCCEIARHHHERYDGNGYPDGLRGDEIPIGAQIISVAGRV